MDQYTANLSVPSDSNFKLNKTELVSTSDQQASGAASAFWQAAYDNPVKTGLVAAGAMTAGAALLYASRGRALGRLFGSKAEVLIIEDTPAMGLALKDAVAAAGHKPTWVTSIKSLKPLTGISPEGAEMTLSKRFKVALVDGDLGKGQLTGPELIGALKDRKIVSIGTSSVETFNTAMKTNGAEITQNKAIIYSGLLGGKLDLKAAIKSPATVQEGLDKFRAAFQSGEFAALRKEADEKLMSYLMKKS